jgi:hypothetical protein
MELLLYNRWTVASSVATVRTPSTSTVYCTSGRAEDKAAVEIKGNAQHGTTYKLHGLLLEKVAVLERAGT